MVLVFAILAGGMVGAWLGIKAAMRVLNPGPLVGEKKPPSILGKVLPENCLWDSVHCDGNVTRKPWYVRVNCPHSLATTYGRTDHRPGPGWMSDNYSGMVCCDCGTVLQEKKIY